MIAITAYDSAWPFLFEAEASNIQQAIGDLVLRIEHVGSTAIPGLAAKPVIDIQVSVASLESLRIYSEPLARLGYSHAPLGPVDLVYPLFEKPAAWPHTHHIHLCVHGSEHERRHIAFRDYLRSNPKVGDEYVELKRRLAALHDGETLESRERYSLSKTAFVAAVLNLASTSECSG